MMKRGSSWQSEEEEELSAILTHILGKSLCDACFDHYHFPSVHCVSGHVLDAGRQWLVNVCVYANVLLSSEFLSNCQGVYLHFIFQTWVRVCLSPTGTPRLPHPQLFAVYL